MNKDNNDYIIQNFYNFIKSSLDFYDIHLNINNNIYKNLHRHEIISKKNSEQIFFYNKNNEILIKGKYQIIGIFNRNTKIFNWGWAISNLKNDLIAYSKELLNYGLNLSKEHIILKHLLTKTDIYVSNILFENVIVSLTSYLLKKNYIFIRLDKEKNYIINMYLIEK
jgi:hypothetical protein